MGRSPRQDGRQRGIGTARWLGALRAAAPGCGAGAEPVPARQRGFLGPAWQLPPQDGLRLPEEGLGGPSLSPAYPGPCECLSWDTGGQAQVCRGSTSPAPTLHTRGERTMPQRGYCCQLFPPQCSAQKQRSAIRCDRVFICEGSCFFLAAPHHVLGSVPCVPGQCRLFWRTAAQLAPDF